ncbi:ABC transporter ATP-binding protein [Maribacter sp.]|nr:ABC transporter ATP-binding protein [Maribacter sp.]
MNLDTAHSILTVTDLAVGYKNSSVAKGINFSLSEGELMAIIGINGIGKSTLLRTLGKVQQQLSGTIQIEGKPLAHYKAVSLASKISMVLTEPIASKNLSVLELIALGRQPYTNWIGSLTQTDTSKINEAIQMLELESLQYKKCYELSDGQLQRAMIARAVAQDTPIMMLDEPTTHLDLYHKVQLLKLLQRIAHETKKTIVFTSHEIEMALQLCDKILVLDDTTNPFGSPESLITQKAFDTLFPTDALVFDSKTKSFRIKK